MNREPKCISSINWCVDPTDITCPDGQVLEDGECVIPSPPPQVPVPAPTPTPAPTNSTSPNPGGVIEQPATAPSEPCEVWNIDGQSPTESTSTAAPSADNCQNFLIECPTNVVKVIRGSTKDIKCTVKSLQGFNSPVALTCTPPPNQPTITCKISPTSVTPPANGNVPFTLTVTTTKDTPLGNQQIKVQGTSGGLQREALVTIRVMPESFTISFAAFIPYNYVEYPPQYSCYSTFEGKRVPLLGIGDGRSFDPNSNSYRTKQVAIVVTDPADSDGIKDGTSLWNVIGLSKGYVPDALADRKIDSSDDDSVLNDCHLLHQRALAGNKNMQITVKKISDNKISIHMCCGAGSPMKTEIPAPSAPEINWDFTITIDTSGDTPKYTAKGMIDAFPAYELYINGQNIYKYTPGPGPHTFRDVSMLFPPLDIRFDVAGPLEPY